MRSVAFIFFKRKKKIPSVIRCDWSETSGKMWAVMWSRDVDARVQRICGIAHIWIYGQFDLVFHILTEWKLERYARSPFGEFSPGCLKKKYIKGFVSWISLFKWMKVHLFLHKTTKCSNNEFFKLRDVPSAPHMKKKECDYVEVHDVLDGNLAETQLVKLHKAVHSWVLFKSSPQRPSLLLFTFKSCKINNCSKRPRFSVLCTCVRVMSAFPFPLLLRCAS